jgi:hypothetical protein
MTLSEAVSRDPRLLVLRCVEELHISLERNTHNVPRDDRFHVRVRGRIVFSGPYASAQARYERALEAQLWRRLAELRRGSSKAHGLQRSPGVRFLAIASRSNGRYAGRRRLRWRALLPSEAGTHRWPMPLA